MRRFAAFTNQYPWQWQPADVDAFFAHLNSGPRPLAESTGRGFQVILTTRGRKSGLERTVPLQFFPDGDRMIVVAANSGLPSPPGWYFNLRAAPRARVEVAGRTLQVRAEELSADEAAAFWPRVLQAAPDYARYPKRTSRRIPLIRLVPEN